MARLLTFLRPYLCPQPRPTLKEPSLAYLRLYSAIHSKDQALASNNDPPPPPDFGNSNWRSQLLSGEKRCPTWLYQSGHRVRRLLDHRLLEQLYSHLKPNAVATTYEEHVEGNHNKYRFYLHNSYSQEGCWPTEQLAGTCHSSPWNINTNQYRSCAITRN